MKLRKLQLENFRNYKKYSFSFPENKQITILIGPNGAGKTNFLEAIHVLSIGKSFRTISREDLIEWEKEFMRCQCEIISNEETESLEIFYSIKPEKKKNFKKNDVNLKNSEYLGNLLTVLFHPKDLNILYLSPSYRRKYLNIILSQTDKKYLDALSKYKKVLKQRNKLLYDIKERIFKKINAKVLEEDLDAWDTEIIQYGTYIIQKRIQFSEFLKENIQNIYREISGKEEFLEIKYLNNVEKKSNNNIKTLYKESITKSREKDIKEAKTNIGPHVDDLTFYLNKKKISTSASRGEFRSILLAMKLAEIKYIQEKTNKNPVLLLDDVFSELDRKRQEHLFKSIKNCQTIITTTEISNIENLAKESENIEFVKLE